MRLILSFFNMAIVLISCESAQEKENRLQLEKQARIELEVHRQKAEEERNEAEEIKRKAQELYNRYINNSLANGAPPYSTCFGGNQSCTEWGCSEIQVNSRKDSDVVVTFKSRNKVIKHDYNKAGNRYTFQLPNGEYQPFFYYGKGWNPEKEMPSETCENLKGGFISNEDFGKDDAQELTNTILTYSLILQESDNFSKRPSGSYEAF